MNNTAHQIIAGAINRLDKANNPHMKALQADLVHDLVKLIEQAETKATHGLDLPFCPRLNSDATKEDLVGRMMANALQQMQSRLMAR